MFAIFKKEINAFFSSLIGYVIIAIFLAVNAVFIWVQPGNNILDFGIADLSLFFKNAPYIFLLLIPALTMRAFAEEKNTGTIEILFTKPISAFTIIVSKYLACVTLVVIALIPTLLYIYSIYQLGMPVGNIDMGATAGSYLGLLLLASTYVAIGIFSSTLSDSQIIAFVISIVLCLIITEGVQILANVPALEFAGLFILELGVLEHYASISRGVILSSDIIYFFSAIIFFLLATSVMIQKRKW